jgi:stearoyl-CoA desaturase (delta-9 desaturase)
LGEKPGVLTRIVVTDTAPTTNRLFEKILVAIFLFLPPIGGLIALGYALQDQVKFWSIVGALAYICLIVGIHIKWIRPAFRRYPWVTGYKDLYKASKKYSPRHPKLMKRAWWARVRRSLYRIGFAILLAPGFYVLYQLLGHHLLWFLGGYAVAGFGITVGYHRIGTHPSFKAHPIVKGILLAMGSTAMQGPAGEWLKKHSKHHAFGETSADVHSPYVFEEGKRAIFKEQVYAFLHSFMMWAFREPSLMRPRGMSIEKWREQLLANSPDPATFRYRDEDAYHWEARDKQGNIVASTESLIKKRWARLVEVIIGIEKDPVVKFVSNPLVYLTLVASTIAVPYYVGGISVWESLARVCFLNWVTFGVNSVCHIWGEQPFVTPDNSRNNAVIEILALGEGGHNTHHKSELWAQHGVFAWQTDFAAIVVKSLRFVGLAKDLNLATKQEVVRSWIKWRQREPWMQGYPMKTFVEGAPKRALKKLESQRAKG